VTTIIPTCDYIFVVPICETSTITNTIFPEERGGSVARIMRAQLVKAVSSS
jgi:hypothetical protein